MLPIRYKLKSLLISIASAVFGMLPRMGTFRPIKGRFRAFSELEYNSLSGGVITNSQPPGRCVSGSITELAGMTQHDLQPWPIFWTCTKNASLVGKALHWRNEKDQICSECVFNGPVRRHFRGEESLGQIFIGDPYSLEGSWTSIGSNWGTGSNYYHWFTDCLTRLAAREHLPEETKILIPDSTAPFVDETLKMLGVHNLCHRPPARHINVETYYFCSPTAMTGAWNPFGYGWLREKFATQLHHDQLGPPVFLTRKNTNRIPQVLGKLESLFNDAGFEIIDCGQHSVAEQMRISSRASRIAGIHGAAMTNIMWARPGTPILEIFERSYLNGCYEQIANYCKLDYSHLILDNQHSIDAIIGWASEIKTKQVFT